jgi:hypothetical protein
MLTIIIHVKKLWLLPTIAIIIHIWSSPQFQIRCKNPNNWWQHYLSFYFYLFYSEGRRTLNVKICHYLSQTRFFGIIMQKNFFPTLFLLKFLVCTYLNQYLFYFMFVWNFSALHLFTMLILIFLKIGNKHNLTTQCGDKLFIKHNLHHIIETLYGHQ